jgi:radical SAM protein with 4Fe4S-binding SPASM domain
MGALEDRVIDGSMARKVPISAHVDLTMRCNEVCVHCYRVIEDRAELTTDEVKRVLDELAEAGALYLTFSGGEIFLRNDLFELIEHAKRRHFDVRLKSNALLITEERARRLRELGVRQVDVSIYSADPALHDAVTKVPGSLVRSLAGVERLLAAGLRVKLACPLMRDTVGGYRAVLALADRLGVPCGFDPMITSKNDGDRATVPLRIGRAQLREVRSNPRLNPEAGRTVGPLPAVRPDLDEYICGAGQNAVYVSAYGDIMPCVALPIACGNVREAPFKDIWYASPEMRRVRAITVRDLHTCSTCSASYFCTRCPGQALVEDGDLFGPSTAACEQSLVAAEAAGVAVIPASMLARGRTTRP